MRTLAAALLLPCTPELFWRVFFDPQYLRALYLEELGYKKFEVIEITESSRKLRIVPNLNLPRPLEALIGESFAYEEHGTLDRARNQWTWRMVQPTDLRSTATPRDGVIATRGSISIEATARNQCRHSNEVIIEANLFGLGSLIESTVENEFRTGWAKEAALLARWIEKLARVK